MHHLAKSSAFNFYIPLSCNCVDFLHGAAGQIADSATCERQSLPERPMRCVTMNVARLAAS